MSFADLKVIELATVLAGPSVGMFFAELGASVLKIENPKTNGDMTRHWKLPTEDQTGAISAHYSSVNYKKEVEFIDFSKPEGYSKLLALIKDCDILLTNFKPGSAEKLLLDYPRVKRVNSNIIYAELTGFGSDDIRPAFDVVLQAETGFMGMTGEPGQPPVKMPVALIDVIAAHHLKEGILTALIQRKKNSPQKVEVSLYDAALSSLVNQASNYLMAGHVPQPMGSKHPNIAPYGDQFLTKDKKWFVLAVGTDNQFKKLHETLGITVLNNNQQFDTNAKRVTQREALNAILQKEIKLWERSKIQDVLLAAGVPCGAVKMLNEVFQEEKATHLVLEEDIDGVKTKRVKSKLFKISS